jgi:hypothetical protein
MQDMLQYKYILSFQFDIMFDFENWTNIDVFLNPKLEFNEMIMIRNMRFFFSNYMWTMVIHDKNKKKTKN